MTIEEPRTAIPNTEKLLAMTPGPELDALIHEHVFGQCPHIWKWAPPELDEEGFEVDHGDYPPKVCRLCGKQVAGLGFQVNGKPDCPRYSEDEMTVGLILGRLSKMNLYVWLRRFSNNGLWVSMVAGSDFQAGSDVRAASLNVALCLSVLCWLNGSWWTVQG